VWAEDIDVEEQPVLGIDRHPDIGDLLLILVGKVEAML